MSNHVWSKEEVAWCRARQHLTREDLAESITAQFGFCCNASMIHGVRCRYKMANGRSYQFQKGNIPFNKGKKGVNGRSNTTFAKGNRPSNALPLGSERSNDGIIEVKIAEPKGWQSKHSLIWQAANGPIPQGHVVIFADSDRRNFDPSNLLLVSRAELAVMNKDRMITDNSQATTVGRTIARIKIACLARTRRPKEEQR